ncbi:MAG TPA: aminotransferase class V-fold PLP-dependent enzyme [Puia sp.]|nr:aminotransferase class V-fold PLP-dependent enzyme [Puia sp.]
MTTLETYFSAFRPNIIGQQACFDTPFGRKRLLYADWTASGRAYRPIEMKLLEEVLPFYGNTHTEATVTGERMSAAYEGAKQIIRDHVGAREEDVVLFCGSGMTSAVAKLQRMMGLRHHPPGDTDDRPLVMVTHMEHHSNHMSWLETGATVEVIRPDDAGNVDPGHLTELLDRYRSRKVKIAAVTACSNVTGIATPYSEIARVMHEAGGWCFVDFATAAPYEKMDMTAVDAIYFSIHKFLGGPGTPGVLVFNRKLYAHGVPDQPGGGTILYSNPWGGREYVSDIEAREDGGTPPILQGIKAGLCIRLKEEMGIDRMLQRESELVARLMDRLETIRGIGILAANHRKRLGVISLLFSGMHHDTVVRALNDRFGIQARGGCSCAGTYGHYLLGIGRPQSETIRQALLAGDWKSKPGWVRLSLHPTMTDEEIDHIAAAVDYLSGSPDLSNLRDGPLSKETIADRGAVVAGGRTGLLERLQT